MGSRKSDRLRRQIAQAYKHQEHVMELLYGIGVVFGEFHPDYQEYFELISNSAVVTMKLIRDISIKAWGYWPEDIKTWLQ